MPVSEVAPGPFARTFFELAFLRSATVGQMQHAGTLGHNRDLVPRTHAIADELLSIIRGYRDVSYDIQGLRDRGVDVLVSTEDPMYRRVGIQVKSHDEVLSGGLVGTLQRQYAEAANAYDIHVLDYYIALFADAGDRRVVDRCRDVAAAFSTTRNVYVVGPRNAGALLDVGRYEIDAIVKSHLWDGDPVVRAAIEETVGWTIAETRVVIHLVVDCLLEGECSLESLGDRGMELADAGDFVEEFDWIRVDNGIALPTRIGFEAVSSVLLDAQVRFGYRKLELLEFAEDLFLAGRRQMVDLDDRLAEFLEGAQPSGVIDGEALQRSSLLLPDEVDRIAARVGFAEFDRNVEEDWSRLTERIWAVVYSDGWYNGLPPEE